MSLKGLKLLKLVQELREDLPEISKITKILSEKFREKGLGNFQKVDVAIFIKRLLSKRDVKSSAISEILNILKKEIEAKLDKLKV